MSENPMNPCLIRVSGVRSLSDGVNVGTRNKAKEDLQNLIESTGWSLEKAMQALRIPLEEKDHYEKALKKQH